MWDCHNAGVTIARAPLDVHRLLDRLGTVDVRVVERIGSTNTELRQRLTAGDWRTPVLLAAEHQQAGRGRAGHDWRTPAGAALTFSLALRPQRSRESWGWLPLLTGLAVIRAVEQVTGLHPALKWPNDVLLPADAVVPGWGGHRKAVGILTETVDAGTVIVGIGINVDQDAAELPVPHAGSLRTAGAAGVDRTALLIAVVREVLSLVGGPRDAAAEGEVRERCVTVGTVIEADMPGGDRLTGLAEGIDPDGALLVRVDGALRTMRAGDLRHVRPGVN